MDLYVLFLKYTELEFSEWEERRAFIDLSL